MGGEVRADGEAVAGEGADNAAAAEDGLIEGNVDTSIPASGWCLLSASPCTRTS